MIKITDKTLCCGCTACATVCPNQCIHMQRDVKGFLYPIVNTNICTDCKLCEEACPVKNTPSPYDKTVAFAAQTNSTDMRMKSTSGGMFFELSRQIILEGGYVCGAGYSSDGTVCHKIINKVELIPDLMGSKYVQSDLNSCFSKIIKLLKAKKKVLFIGTPCQSAALKKISQNYMEYLYLVDIVCYGVPSPYLYKKWYENLEHTYQKEIERISFRDKSYGYSAPNVRVIFKDGTYDEQTTEIKSYMKIFMENLSVRPSCTACKMKGIDRATDITLGDCWSIRKFDKKMDDNKGTTCVYIHSPKGLNLFQQVSNNLVKTEIDTELAVQYDGKKMIECAASNLQQEAFFQQLNEDEYNKTIKQFVPMSLKEKSVTFIKHRVKGNSLFKFILKKYKNR